MKVEPISLSISNLQQIVIKCLFHDAYLSSRGLEIHMHHLSRLINESSIEFTPQSYFFDYLLNSLFFLFCLATLYILSLSVLLLLLLFQ